jgi:hypothetical protein
MKKIMLTVCLMFAIGFSANATVLSQTNATVKETENKISPLILFHNIGENLLNTLTHNYGLNFITAGISTYGMIQTGLDWKWRNLAYDNKFLEQAGFPFRITGMIAPIVTPITLYFIGRNNSDVKLQTAGAAMLQAAGVTQFYHLSLKVSSGRTQPGIVDGVFFAPNKKRDTRTEDFSNEFNWFSRFEIMDGWPSGHTASTMAVAVALCEIYNDKPALKIATYSFALLTGLGLSFTAHFLIIYYTHIP